MNPMAYISFWQVNFLARNVDFSCRAVLFDSVLFYKGRFIVTLVDLPKIINLFHFEKMVIFKAARKTYCSCKKSVKRFNYNLFSMYKKK